LYRLERWALRGALFLLPQLPHDWLRGLAWALGGVVAHVDRRGRRTALENLRVAFPQASLAERRRWCRQSYQVFARTYLELFWSRNLAKGSHEAFWDLVYESAETARSMAQGCIFACPHAGNFEWLSLAAGYAGYPSMIVAEDFKNPALTPIFAELRETSLHTLISSEGALLRLHRHLRRGGRTALLCDLTLPPQQSAVVVRAFGLETCVSAAPAALAQRLGIPVVPCVALRLPDGRHAMRFLNPISVSPAESITQAAQRIWDALEPLLRRDPPIWMWMYKHWRYLPPQRSPAEFPAYANASKRFSKLLTHSPAS
jgi:lauroyl/myristoyl acyltransferase